MISAVVIITYIGITCEINYISGEVNSLPSGGPMTKGVKEVATSIFNQLYLQTSRKLCPVAPPLVPIIL